MKLKVLLVDDEIHLLRNLQTVIPWERMNIEIAAMSRNGEQALEEAERHRPDIILSDIRMPYMDGIALLEQLRLRHIDSAVIMITGYQDFEYARSVIKHGARDYILKPIDYDELARTVERLAVEIRAGKMKMAAEEKKWRRIEHLAFEKMLLDVLLDLPASGISELLDGDEGDGEAPAYSLLLADIDGYAAKSRTWSESERKLWNFAVGNVLHDGLAAAGLRYAVVQPRDGEWAIVLQHDADVASTGQSRTGERLHRLAEGIRQDVLRYVKLPISFAAAPEPVELPGLSVAYKRLQRSLYLAPRGERAIVTPQEPAEAVDSEDSLWNAVEGIVSGLKRRSREEIARCMARLNDHLLHISRQSFVRVEQILHFVVLHLVRELREIDLIAPRQERAVWSKLETATGMKGLLALIAEVVEDGLHAVSSRRTGDQLMLAAQDYIASNLDASIGIEELADRLGISYSYFSMLFKQHFGETFVEYVTGRRMELAKTLLLHSDKSVVQIGQAIGYPERRYFTKVFWKHTGMSPSEYRERRGGQETAERERAE